MGLNAKAGALVRFEETGAAGLAAALATFDGWGAAEFTDGTGNNQANILHFATMTLAASATANIDLAGTLTDPIGGAAVFAKVKALAIRARADNVNSLIVGGAATNAWVGPFGAATHTVTLPPGGQLVLVAPLAGWTVTPTTGDLLKVANSAAGSSITFDVCIIGTNA